MVRRPAREVPLARAEGVVPARGGARRRYPCVRVYCVISGSPYDEGASGIKKWKRARARALARVGAAGARSVPSAF